MRKTEENIPQVLLVDDSKSVLAFESAALGQYYRLSTAKDGQQALAMLEDFIPAAVVLDLSMPIMGGADVLKRLRVWPNPDIAECGVLMLSTESQRARECLELGADDFLSKPADSSILQTRVAAVVETAAQRIAQRQENFLFLQVAKRRLAVPVREVILIAPRCALNPLPGAPTFIRGFFDFQKKAIPVMDLALHLGWSNHLPLIERKLVIVRIQKRALAIEVDLVHDPESFSQDEIQAADELGGLSLGHLARFLRGMVRAKNGDLIPVLQTQGLIQARLLPRIFKALDERAAA